MAAPIRTCVTFIRATNLLHKHTLQTPFLIPSCSITISQIREGKRTCRPPAWFVKKKERMSNTFKGELTRDNREFLQEVVEDKYRQVIQSPLREPPWERNEWDSRKTKRTGVLGVKIGVIPQWTEEGKKFFCTIVQVLDNHVVRYIPPAEFSQSEGYKSRWRGLYGSCVVGALSADPMLFTKEYNNLFKESGVPPKRRLTRFLVTPDAAVQPGTPLHATHFKVGGFVDYQAKTIGHGFQGVVKRWGMKGGPKAGGATKWHRRIGSISDGRTKRGLWKGRKMPGHMGMEIRTLKGLKIWRINTQYNLLYLMGPATPGPTHCYVRLIDTVLPKRSTMEDLPMPTWFPEDEKEPLPEEIFAPGLFRFDQPSVVFEEKEEQVKVKSHKQKKKK